MTGGELGSVTHLSSIRKGGGGGIRGLPIF